MRRGLPEVDVFRRASTAGIAHHGLDSVLALPLRDPLTGHLPRSGNRIREHSHPAAVALADALIPFKLLERLLEAREIVVVQLTPCESDG